MGFLDKFNLARMLGKKQRPAESIPVVTPEPTETVETPPDAVNQGGGERFDDLRTIEYTPEQRFYAEAEELAKAFNGLIIDIGPDLIGVAFAADDDAKAFYTFLSKNRFLQEQGVTFTNFDDDFRGRGADDTLEVNALRWMYTGGTHKYLVRFQPGWKSTASN